MILMYTGTQIFQVNVYRFLKQIDGFKSYKGSVLLLT